MKMKKNGFTLIELITVISVLALLVITGMTVFYRSLRGSSRVEVQKTLDSEVQHITRNMSRLIREGVVVAVGGSDRDVCFANGGLTGASLVVEDAAGYQTTYRLDNNKIASNAAFLSTSNVVVESLNFDWECGSGTFDNLQVSFAASVLGDDGTTGSEGEFVFDLLIRNSVN